MFGDTRKIGLVVDYFTKTAVSEFLKGMEVNETLRERYAFFAFLFTVNQVFGHRFGNKVGTQISLQLRHTKQNDLFQWYQSAERALEQNARIAAQHGMRVDATADGGENLRSLFVGMMLKESGIDGSDLIVVDIYAGKLNQWMLECYAAFFEIRTGRKPEISELF